MLGNYGQIPEDGSTFEVSTDLFDIEVTEFKDHKIEKAVVTMKNTDEEEDEAEKSKLSKTEA